MGVYRTPHAYNIKHDHHTTPTVNNGTGGYREFIYDIDSGTGTRLEDLNNDGTFDALAVYVKDNGRGDENDTLGIVSDPGVIGSSRIRSGDSGNDFIQGTSSADVLSGNAGNDTLDGFSGGDTLDGGIGDDTYFVDNRDDRIVESITSDPNSSVNGVGGIDTVHSW